MSRQFPRCNSLVEYIGCGFKVLGALTDGIADLSDRGKWNKKAILYVTLWLTVTSAIWAYNLSNSARSGTDIAAIIAALMVPISGLQGFVIKFYLEETTRSEQVKAGQVSTPATATATTSLEVKQP